MITLGEIQRYLAGAWNLFLGRKDALRAFDTSSDGFWRSFLAILPIAPLYAFVATADLNATIATASDPAAFNAGTFWFSRALLLAADWVTLPILLAALAGFLGIRHRYTTFIVVRNWSALLSMVPFAGIAVLDLAGLFPGDLIFIPSLVAVAFALRLSYMVARATLAAPIEVAIGYVAFDFLVSLALATTIGRVFGIG